MKIAVVAPPYGQTGGPEVVCSYLVEALVKMGVDVTLFAPADWKTGARHIPTLKQSLWNMADFSQQTEIERRNLIISSQLEVIKYQHEFDIIHLHSQRYAYLVARLTNKPCVLTLHNRSTPRDFAQIRSAGIHTVAISTGRKMHSSVSVVIPNGIPTQEIDFSLKPGGYLVALGRITESKGFHTAIQIAKKTNKQLLIFGRVGTSEERQQYFNEQIVPFLDKNIIFKGELSREDVFPVLRDAAALISPIRDRLTVFPLVVMEALACGTPVIGSEVLEAPSGVEKVGCFSSDPEKLSQAVYSIESFDRKGCREFAEKYFDSSIMADRYLALYREILSERSA